MIAATVLCKLIVMNKKPYIFFLNILQYSILQLNYIVVSNFDSVDEVIVSMPASIAVSRSWVIIPIGSKTAKHAAPRSKSREWLGIRIMRPRGATCLPVDCCKRIRGVMVNMLASSAVESGFEPWSGQIKDYKMGICCFSAKHTSLRRKSKDWLARNQDNVSEWGDMSTRRLLFLIISLKTYLFSS